MLFSFVWYDGFILNRKGHFMSYKTKYLILHSAVFAWMVLPLWGYGSPELAVPIVWVWMSGNVIMWLLYRVMVNEEKTMLKQNRTFEGEGSNVTR